MCQPISNCKVSNYLSLICGNLFQGGGIGDASRERIQIIPTGTTFSIWGGYI